MQILNKFLEMKKKIRDIRIINFKASGNLFRID